MIELNLAESGPETLRAGYDCPCGCHPAVDFARDSKVVSEGCCCGNEFAVGPNAASTLTPKVGFLPQVQAFETHWGTMIEAAWLVGPGVHPEEAGHEHHTEHDHHAAHDDHANHDHAHHDDPAPHDDHAHHGHEASPSSAVIDPVCGMTVEPESARARGLHAAHGGTDYFFCGKGCKLEFGDDPGRFLDPSYVPSM